MPKDVLPTGCILNQSQIKDPMNKRKLKQKAKQNVVVVQQEVGDDAVDADIENQDSDQQISYG
jgi:hypothetical protein